MPDINLSLRLKMVLNTQSMSILHFYDFVEFSWMSKIGQVGNLMQNMLSYMSMNISE